MKALLGAMLLALAALTLLLLGASLFFEDSPQRLEYQVYVDAANRIFVNGEPASEEQVYRLGRDMTIDFELQRHPAATKGFCFVQRGCFED